MNSRLELGPQGASARVAPRGTRGTGIGWVLPPLLLLATAFGTWIVLTGPSGLFAWVVGSAVLLALLWVLVSSLFPAQADRTCPACGRDTLVRLSPETTEGLVCKACRWSDAEQSSFLLAEEEGELEPVVLARRRKLGPVKIRKWSDSQAASALAASDGAHAVRTESTGELEPKGRP